MGNPSTQDPEVHKFPATSRPASNKTLSQRQNQEKKCVNTNKDTIVWVPPSGQESHRGIVNTLGSCWGGLLPPQQADQSLQPKLSRAGATARPAYLHWALEQQQQATKWSWIWSKPNWNTASFNNDESWDLSTGYVPKELKGRISRVQNKRLLADHNKVRKWQGGAHQIPVLYIPSKGWIW